MRDSTGGQQEIELLRDVLRIITAALLLAAPDPALARDSSRLGPRLVQALGRPVPAGGLDIGVVLRRDDLPAAESEREARIAERQQRVLDAVPPGLVLRHRYRSLSGFAGRAPRPVIQALAAHPEVMYVYVDGKVHGTLAQGVPLVGASAVHSRGFTGAGVSVAVIDSGIDATHPGLGPQQLIAEQCYCLDPSLNPNDGCCPPNNRAIESGPGSAEDKNGHGTSVSGIVLAGGSPLGVAPDASLVAVKVLDSNAVGHFSDIAAGLNWVRTTTFNPPVRVVNVSVGDGVEYASSSVGVCSNSNTATAIANLVAAGISVFVSSGNDGFDAGVSFPACVADAIAVGGVYDSFYSQVGWCTSSGCNPLLCTDFNTVPDDFVCHTNSGALLDLLAPNFETITWQLGGGTIAFAGTSASSPYAAGQAALLYQADPSLTAAGVRTLLTSHGPLVTNPDNGLSFRRADVDEALDTLIGPDSDGDGVADPDDNCRDVANADQRDTNLDGYGNLCDSDFNDDGLVGGADYSQVITAFDASSDEPAYDADLDADGDGVIGGPEFVLLIGSYGGSPGPSGLACAGSIPCP